MRRLLTWAAATSIPVIAGLVLRQTLYGPDPESGGALAVVLAWSFALPLLVDRWARGGTLYHRIKLGLPSVFACWVLVHFALLVAADKNPNAVVDGKLLRWSMIAAIAAPTVGMFTVLLLPADRITGISRKLNITIVTALLMFAGYEIWARANQPSGKTGRISEESWLYEPAGGEPRYATKPSHDFVYGYPSNPRGYFHENNSVTHAINAEGYRGPLRAIPKPDDVYRILILGDSYAFGFGVHDEDTAGAQLEQALAEGVDGKRVEVMTLAAPGYNSSDERDILRAMGLKYSPDLVIVWYAINDVDGDWRPAQEEAAKQRRLEELPWYLELSVGARRIADGATLFVGQRRYPRAQVAEYTHDGPEWRRNKAAIREMHQLVSGTGGKLVVAIEPWLKNLMPGQYGYRAAHEVIEKFCADEGIPCYDLFEPIRGRQAASLWVHPSDIHSNEIAKRAYARYLVDHMRTDGVL